MTRNNSNDSRIIIKFKVIYTCEATITAKPKAKEICMTDGPCPKVYGFILPKHAMHPRKIKIAVPINSPRTAKTMFQLLVSSVFFSPEILMDIFVFNMSMISSTSCCVHRRNAKFLDIYLMICEFMNYASRGKDNVRAFRVIISDKRYSVLSNRKKRYLYQSTCILNDNNDRINCIIYYFYKSTN